MPTAGAPAAWRLLLHPPADAYRNMATDQALVKLAGQPLLRLYAWQPWAISVGYHQAFAEIDWRRCWRDGIDIVRRPTGGRAVLHAEELTYCVVVPATHPWHRDGVVRVHRRISEALATGLRQLGLPVRMVHDRAATEKGYANEFSCFARSVRHEIVAQRKKIIGNAQRRYPEGLLQHGSILIGRAHAKLGGYVKSASAGDRYEAVLAERAIAIEQILGYLPEWQAVADAVVSGFKSTFALQFSESEMTPEEQALSGKIKHELLQEIHGLANS